MLMTRQWTIPSPDTFSIPPIREFVGRYARKADRIIDPFARDSEIADVTNDLNTKTKAQHHLDYAAFLTLMKAKGETFDLVLFDPPYSPRQISECYKEIGRPVTTADTQNGRFVKSSRDLLMPLLRSNAVVLSFGWNSSGMGKGRRFDIEEIMIVCHGGVHNDTICMAERWKS